MIKIGAGWNKVNEKGIYISLAFEKSAECLVIDLQKASMIMFENKDKTEEKQPDWLLFLGEKGERA
jgi:uncharacterized protein (DUF736 family)